MQKIHDCPLCLGIGTEFYNDTSKTYYQCKTCKGIFIGAAHLLLPQDERMRYETHNNNPEDSRYQNFVSPITQEIMRDFSPHHAGLDFGSGSGSPISFVLRKNEYTIDEYDPFFAPNTKLLEKKYDYIACCEVMEHFYNPRKEFLLLYSLLHENAMLYCMTDMYNPTINFSAWYYKNDPTHVFIYQSETIAWIAANFPFSSYTISNRLVIFEK